MTPFRRLLRHFYAQFFRVEFDSGEGDLSAGPVLAMLASPGAIMAMILFGKYSSLLRWVRRNFHFNPDIASIPDKYTFIALSIAITGIVTVVRWDSLFPDRRDHANLIPLPIHSRTILLAKAAALCGFAAVFLIDVNFVSTFLFPMIVMEDHGTMGETGRFIFAHAVAVFAAGLWAFAAFLALTGTLMSILPSNIFRRSRRYIQFACVTVLLLLFMSASSGSADLRSSWLPPMWFLGLYQVVQGKANPAFQQLCAIALQALGGTILLAVIAYTASYRRYFLRSAEVAEGSSAVLKIPQRILELDRFASRSSTDRAAIRFVLRTIARSDRHTAILASLLGLGFALAVQSASSSDLFSPVLILTYTFLTGLRISLGVPSAVAANWVFRCAPDDSSNPGLIVRTLLFLALAIVVALSSVFFLITHGPIVTILHVIFSISASALLIELLAADFRAIPLTCSWLPLSENGVLAMAVWGAGLAIFGYGFGKMEAFLVMDAPRLIPWLVAAGAAWFGLRHLRNTHQPIEWADTRGELDLLRISQ